MGLLSKLTVRISTDDSQMKSGLTKTEGALTRSVQKMGKMGKKLTKSVTLPIMGVAALAAKSYIDLEKSMANVGTLIGGNAERTKELTREVQDLAMESGTATSTLSEGLYQVISAFGDSEESMRLLNTANKAGIAGLADTSDSVNLLSTVIKGYNLDMSEAERISDFAFQTVKLGQTTFGELASSMGTVVPLAGELNVKQEELWGTMATLTGVTGNTSEVSNQLRGVFAALIRPTETMSKTMKDLGYTSGRAMLDAHGLQGTLNILKDAAGGSDQQLASMFGRVEALGAVLALTGSQSDNFTEKIAAMTESGGAMEEAYATATDTFQHKLDRALQIATVGLQEIGSVILDIATPAMEGLLPKLLEAVETFRDLDPEVQENYIKMGLYAAAVGPAMSLVSNFVLTLGGLKFMLGGTMLGKALSVGAGMFVKFGLPVLALTAIFVGLYDAIRKAMDAYSQGQLLWQQDKNLSPEAKAYRAALTADQAGADPGTRPTTLYMDTGGEKATPSTATRTAVPMMAAGGTVQRGGLAIVGERGPELLNLNRGAEVTPLDKAGTQIVFNITGNNISGEDDSRRVAEDIMRHLRRAGVVTI